MSGLDHSGQLVQRNGDTEYKVELRDGGLFLKRNERLVRRLTPMELYRLHDEGAI